MISLIIKSIIEEIMWTKESNTLRWGYLKIKISTNYHYYNRRINNVVVIHNPRLLDG